MADTAPPLPDLVVYWTNYLRRYPSEPGAWVEAIEAMGALPPADRPTMARQVAALDPPDTRAAVYRSVFLFMLTGDLAALSAAGRAVAQAGEIERMHAFFVFAWGMANSRAEHRGRFRAVIEAAGFPELLVRPAQALADLLPPPARPARATRRIAVLCQHLSGFAQAATRLALEHAGLLAATGHEVCVFSAQEIANAGIEGWLGCAAPLELTPPAPADWKPLASSATFQVSVAPHAWPMLARWRSTGAKLAAFAPEVVLFVGFHSALLEWVHRHYPVLGLSVHTLPPLGPVDIWLHQYDTGSLPPPWRGIAQPEPFAYAHRLALPPPQAVSLAGLGLQPGTRLAVSVGYRLSSEIGPEWAAQALALLELHKDWVWLLVGDANAPAGLRTDHPQVRVLPHQEHIDALLAQCSLYLNPPRMGGGFSVMNAMARGVACVSLGGSDGGDKLGPWAVASDAEYWQRAATYLADDGARKECGQALEQRFRALYDLGTAMPRLVEALDAVRARRARNQAT